MLVLLVAAPGATAQTTICRGNHYLLIDKSAFPTIRNLRAVNLPTLTEGYAPRCLVAESIASDIQYYWSNHQRFPRSVWPHGASWTGHIWTLRYTKRHLRSEPAVQYEHAVARRGRRAVTMELLS